MKFSYRSNLALKSLEEGSLIRFHYNNPDFPYGGVYVNIIHSFFNEYKSYFRKNIQVVTNTFFENAQSNLDKIIKGVFADFDKKQKIDLRSILEVLDINEVYGTIIMGKRTIFYYMNNKNIFRALECIQVEGLLFPVYFNINENSFDNAIKLSFDKNSDLMVFSNVITILLFSKYADVETKHLSKNQKCKIRNVKYKNETDLDVDILDSKWFTNLVKSDSFNVRGHFRLQPYKNHNGKWTKKLIWINEFEKNGYTRKAKILNE